MSTLAVALATPSHFSMLQLRGTPSEPPPLSKLGLETMLVALTLALAGLIGNKIPDVMARRMRIRATLGILIFGHENFPFLDPCPIHVFHIWLASLQI